MRLYVLTLCDELRRFCERAVDPRRVDVQQIPSAIEIPQDASSPEHRAVLLIGAQAYLKDPESGSASQLLGFLGSAILCRDFDEARRVHSATRPELETIVCPDAPSLALRLSDWLGLEAVSRESDILSRQIRDIAEALEVSSQDMTVLHQKISFLDRQREKLSRVLETMNMLSRLSQELNCLDVDEIINICVNKIPLLVNARYASFYMHNYAQHLLELKRHNHGYRINEIIRINEDSTSVMYRALHERRIILIRDFDEYENMHRIKVERPHSRNYTSRSCIIAPLLAGDRVVAVLNMADKRNGSFFDEVNDLPPLEQISVLAGTAIRNWQLFQEVRVQAKTDAMTSFINHQTFFDELEKEVLRARRYQGPLSVLMIDVDNFKMFNDVYGHQVGDEILTEVASIIKLNIRDTDIPARYGGDEFAVILAEADQERACVVGERIREAIDAFRKDRRFHLSVSIGVAEYDPGWTVADFVSNADKALYEAKSRGRNQVAALSSV